MGVICEIGNVIRLQSYKCCYIIYIAVKSDLIVAVITFYMWVHLRPVVADCVTLEWFYTVRVLLKLCTVFLHMIYDPRSGISVVVFI